MTLLDAFGAACWAAGVARRTYGERSDEYRDALRVMENAKRRWHEQLQAEALGGAA